MAKSAGWTVSLVKNATAQSPLPLHVTVPKNAQVGKEFSVTVIPPKDGVKKSIFQGQKVLIGLGKATKSEPSSSSTQPTEPQKTGHTWGACAEVTAPSRSAAGFCACRVWRASLGRHNRIHDSTLWN